MIALPPVLDGAVQLTVADPLPAVAVTPLGAPGTDGCVSDTSSRYIQVGSPPPSWCTTVWPAYGVMSKVTGIQVWEFELLLNTLASVCPDVLWIWASCQSYTQPLPEQRPSVVAGQYQKLRVVLPEEGIATVWVRVLSPRGSTSGATVPSRAEALPEWNWTVLPVGGATPPAVHEVRPFSKPPLRTCTMLAEGVTALDCADARPAPAGLDAVTVKV